MVRVSCCTCAHTSDSVIIARHDHGSKGKGRERAIAAECFTRAARRAAAAAKANDGSNRAFGEGASSRGGDGGGGGSAGGSKSQWFLPRLRRPQGRDASNMFGDNTRRHGHDHDHDPDDVCIPARRAGFGIGWGLLATYNVRMDDHDHTSNYES